MYHSAGCLGGIMLVMGGVNTEARVTLDDFCLFDFTSSTWLKVRMAKTKGGAKFTPQCLYENDL